MKTMAHKNQKNLKSKGLNCLVNYNKLMKQLQKGERVYKQRIISSWNSYNLNDDIYGYIGNKKVLLLAKDSWESNTAALALLSKHRLTKPVDENLTAKQAVNLKTLKQELSRIKQNVLTYQLPDFTNSIKAAEQLLNHLSLDQSITNKIALLRESAPLIFDHSILTAFLMVEIGIKYKFDKERLLDSFTAGLFHNIGNLYIDPELFTKSVLTDEEKETIEAHPVAGYQILKTAGNFSKRMLDAVLDHHELIDGTGYPRKLSGAEISQDARLLNVVSTYCALICRGKSAESSLSMLKVCTRRNVLGKIRILAKYDPKAVNTLYGIVEETRKVHQIVDDKASWDLKVLVSELPILLHYIDKAHDAVNFYSSDCIYRIGKSDLQYAKENIEHLYYNLNRCGFTMVGKEVAVDESWEQCLLNDAMIIMSTLLRHTEIVFKILGSLKMKAGVPDMPDLEEYMHQILASLKTIAHHSLHIEQLPYLHS